MSAIPRPPRTDLAVAVAEHVERHSQDALLWHSQRSYQLAMLFAEARGLDVDAEVVYAGALMHDLGLTAHHHSAATRFEVAGANAARQLVRAEGMNDTRAENVWDVVALHGCDGIAEHKSAEAAVVFWGIDADVVGTGLDELDQRTVAEIMRTRAGFAEPFCAAVCADLRPKPHTAYFNWMSPIAAARLADYDEPDLVAAIEAHPYESQSTGDNNSGADDQRQ